MTELWRGTAPLVLASKSLARQRLLAAAGVPFESQAAKIDERAIETQHLRMGAGAPKIALELAKEKALQVSRLKQGRLVVGADQTLSFAGRIIGKPADRRAARAQLDVMSGQTHRLYSACGVAKDGLILFAIVDMAELSCRKLSPAFMAAFLEQADEALLSSAGGYQLEGLGIHLFDRIIGDHATILGLPLLPLLKFLREEGSLLA
ncbi:MAG: Maf family protein [Alphaproteobacteria bacterium]|nr:Maf family protein [Alphaproteobacteria bacterium]